MTSQAKPTPVPCIEGCGRVTAGYKTNSGRCTPCARKLAAGSQNSPRCKKCGRITPLKKDHTCASVDLKGPRYCIDCNSLLSSKGFERWNKRCAKCGKKRWREKEREERITLRAVFGGVCSKCGYSRCPDALHFHHTDRSEKYEWNYRGHGGASIKEIKAHPERFMLLCANCHIELHAEERL